MYIDVVVFDVEIVRLAKLSGGLDKLLVVIKTEELGKKCEVGKISLGARCACKIVVVLDNKIKCCKFDVKILPDFVVGCHNNNLRDNNNCGCLTVSACARLR